MSKERAQRRAARIAEAEKRTAAQQRRAERIARRAALKKKLVPERGRVGRIPGRYTRAQIRGVVGILALVLLFVFFLVPSWPLRIGLVCLSLIGLPALLTLTFDRSSR